MTEERPSSPGSYIGHEPELAADTIPGGVGPVDERVAGTSTQSTGVGAADDRAQEPRTREDQSVTEGHRQQDRPFTKDQREQAGG